jgi:hypothetical protein
MNTGETKMKNTYRVILNNKNLNGFFAQTYHADTIEGKNRLKRNASRTTSRTYKYLNLIIYTYLVIDKNEEDFGKELFDVDLGFSIKPKELDFNTTIESSLPKKPKPRHKWMGGHGKATDFFVYSFPIKNGDNFFNIEGNDLIDRWVKQTKLPDYEVK